MIGASFDVNTLTENARKIVVNSPVKLVGKAAENGTFVGSGVIVQKNEESGEIVVLTAAHNVSVFNSTKEIKNNFDTALFSENVKVRAGSGKETPVTGLRFLKEPGSATGLDLLLIKATSVEIATEVTPASWPKNIGTHGFDIQNLKAVESRFLQFLKNLKRTTTFLNVGFGASSLSGDPTEDSKVQYRSVNFKDAKYLPKSKEDHLNLFVVGASKQSSTARGDSGGPLFMIIDDDVILIAVTLGADYFEDKIDDSTNTVENNAFTSVLGQTLSG